MVKQSDVRIGPNVLAAYATYYKSPSTRERICTQAVHTEFALPIFRSMMKLPSNLTVRFAGTKSRSLRGRYFDNEKLVLISQSIVGTKNWMQTLAHELVHAEQYHTGKLKDEWIGGRWMSMWEGSIVSSRGTTYSAYRALPWEQEAFARQEELAACVLRQLGLE